MEGKKACKMYWTISPITVKENTLFHCLVKLHPWHTKSSQKSTRKKKGAGKERQIVSELFLSPD